jgi:hypothetical protein
MSEASALIPTGTEGLFAPPFKGIVPPFHGPLGRAPVRLQRTKRRANFTPTGARYVGRPTIHGNPFERRPRIGHARSVILYDAWLQNQLTSHILTCAGFGEDEIVSLARWRRQLMPQLIRLRGFDLQCWCALSSAWCHAETQLRICNGPLHELERLAA